MSDLKIHQNSRSGVQVEWRGVLFTLRPNGHHGLMGSIAVQEDGQTIMLEFHGSHPEQPMPMKFHEEVVEPEEGQEGRTP